MSSRKAKSPTKASTWNKVRFDLSDRISEMSYEEEGIVIPPLPPIVRLRSAVSRNRVSQGLPYVLPVDKGKNSIDNHYRTDMRTMFTNPYDLDDPSRYREHRVLASSKFHFGPNVVPKRLMQPLLMDEDIDVNIDSRKVIEKFNTTKPRTGINAENMKIYCPEKLKKRSSLYLPIHVKLSEDTKRLKRGLTKILEGTHEGFQEEKTKNLKSQFNGDLVSRNDPFIVSSQGVKKYSKTAGHVASYSDIKDRDPPEVMLPADSLSTLNKEKSNSIWKWLHQGENTNHFDYFISVCGSKITAT